MTTDVSRVCLVCVRPWYCSSLRHPWSPAHGRHRPGRTLLVYYPLCHWVWGGGWLARLGVCDFAGGIVIHTSAGVASLVTALRLGPRVGFAGLASHSLAPHNLPMAATGAGLLWVGWFAFNGGSALAVGSLAASALLSTHVAGAGGALVWLALDWGHAGRPTFVGCINGALDWGSPA